MHAFHRILLVAIAIALMSFAASAVQAGGVNVRLNRFTPFGIRPDVAVRGHGGNVNVQVNGFGGVNVNAFRVNGFRSNVFFVPQPQAVFVTPHFIAPSSYGFQSFGFSGGGCFNSSGCFNNSGFGFCH